MSSRSATASPALTDRWRAARRPITIALLVAFWLVAWILISTGPSPSEGILVYRVDVNEIAAYPRSDAAMDYLNGLAIVSGDGWVNWRDTNRWSVYRPGWGGFLGALALATGGEPATMQTILNLLLATTAPAFLLLVLRLYPGRWDLALAVLAAALWVAKPFFGWQLQRTMMSEGPTVLLALLFCLLAVRLGRRVGEWSWRQGLLMGLVGGALSLVREQSRFGVLLVVAVLALASLGSLRRRLPFFAALVAGTLFVVGPIYIKTSIHLRLPYAGTSFTALYNTLEYTPVGRYVGGSGYAGGVTVPERQATRELQRRVGRGIAAALTRPGEMARDGFLHFSRTIHASVATLVGLRLPPPDKQQPVAGKLAVLYALAGLGLVFAWRRAGPTALAPLVFAVGYLAPTVPFWFYSNRLGMPISWVGWIYIAGALLALPRLGRWRGAGEPEGEASPATAGDAPAGKWPAGRLFLALGGWLILATAALLWFDSRPLPRVDVERLFADQRSRRTLEESGVAVGPALLAEAERLLNGDAPGERLLAGVAVLPMSIAPGDRPVLQPFSKETLVPEAESYDLFYLVSPWKRGGSLRVSRVRLPGGGASALRPGEEVLVVRAAGSEETVGKNRVARLQAAAVLPTSWAE